MKYGIEGAWQAWARLASLSHDHRQVNVDPTSAICPDGWLGVLAIGNRVAAVVPSASLRQRLTEALEGLTADQAVTPDVLLPRLPAVDRTLGPANLFYPPVGYSLKSATIDIAAPRELATLLTAADGDEVEESGIEHIQSPCFVSRSSEGRVAAACGYRRWPNGVAHLSVLADRSERRQGHGFNAAVTAIQDAIDEGLLPQWRARVESSVALAGKLGLERAGAQFSFKLA